MQNTTPDYSVMWDNQSYRNIAYLLLSFPLGLWYFSVLVAGITLVSTTFMIWIGIPILLLLLHICWQMAMFERRRAIDWLGVEIPPVSMEAPTSIFRWSSLTARLSNRMTWKTLAYVLLKFPRLRRYLLFALAGFGLNIVIFHLLNGTAFVEARLARSLLGMSDMDLRLQAAKALAEQERLRAEQTEQRRRELVVNVSHELRAPVASISGHLESLLLAIEDEGQALPPQQLHN